MTSKKTKALCRGCRDDYYNNPGECWSYKNAKVVQRWRIGWWTAPSRVDCFDKVTTLSCHAEPGRFSFEEKLPKHLKEPTP